MTETITFAVQGSSPEPYCVTFQRDQSELRAFCSCQAGQNGIYCKHRIGLLRGVVDGLVGGNIDELILLANWLPDSQLGFALRQFDAAEFALEQAKDHLASTKKAVSSAMRGTNKENE
jgi:hypothetical protein